MPPFVAVVGFLPPPTPAHPASSSSSYPCAHALGLPVMPPPPPLTRRRRAGFRASRAPAASFVALVLVPLSALRRGRTPLDAYAYAVARRRCVAALARRQVCARRRAPVRGTRNEHSSACAPARGDGWHDHGMQRYALCMSGRAGAACGCERGASACAV
ncbi:hypothetical protein DFH09DRAFT_1143529 [Mycena vulgaris]|nr:hypothetical protein DFH09DRAFT_1143529 [Mycena vulgaris]